jgi:transposase
LSTVWQRLRDEAGLDVSLSTFRRYVQVAIPGAVSAADVVVWRPEVPPGEEAQVDFGRLGLWRDSLTGRRRVAWAFILVLTYSRHMFVRVVFRLDLRTWLLCHVLALDFLGGVPHRIVLDNLANGALKPDLYDPKFNRAYAELAHHYGFLDDLSRRIDYHHALGAGPYPARRISFLPLGLGSGRKARKREAARSIRPLPKTRWVLSATFQWPAGSS